MQQGLALGGQGEVTPKLPQVPAADDSVHVWKKGVKAAPQQVYVPRDMCMSDTRLRSIWQVPQAVWLSG